VTRGYVPWLLLLSGLWGSSYFFIKVGVEDMEPTVLMSARCLVAGVLLLAYLLWTRGASAATTQLRAAGRPTLVFGLFNAALPFWLIAWGEKHIDSTVAGIAQATVPIFAFVIALRFLPHERVAPIRWVGVALGLVGVGVLTGVDLPGGWWAVAGTLAVVFSSVSYASAGTYAQLRLKDTPGPVLATGGILIGGLLLLPFALFQLPDELPGWEAFLAVSALAVVGTTFAQLVYFHMLPLYGNPRISLVAYIMPVFAITYGGLFLEEAITGAMVIGLGLILAGVALGSGLALASRRAKTAEEVL
jgi:drug/metabolite transporter (DMT)-like permease